MRKVKLKPCPFCGESKNLRYLKATAAVECLTCFASGPALTDEKTAIAEWNTRPGEAELCEALEAVKTFPKKLRAALAKAVEP